jgi:hypothetical protein
MYRLVYHQVEHFTRGWIIVGNDSANSLVGFRPKGWIITNNLHWSIIV